MLDALSVCVIPCLLEERQLFQLADIDDIIKWRSICVGAGKNIHCKDADEGKAQVDLPVRRRNIQLHSRCALQAINFERSPLAYSSKVCTTCQRMSHYQ